MSRIHKIKNYDNFIDELLDRKPITVSVAASRRLIRWPSASTPALTTTGTIGTYEHRLVYEAQLPSDKKPLLYGESIFRAIQSERGIADTKKRNFRMGALLLAAEDRVTMLQPLLPETTVYIYDGQSDGPMSTETIALLHSNAKELGFTSAFISRAALSL